MPTPNETTDAALMTGAVRAIKDAVAAERERCAAIADRVAASLRNGGAITAVRAIATLIRGRANAK